MSDYPPDPNIMKKSILLLTDLLQDTALADAAVLLAGQLGTNILLLNTNDSIEAISYYPVVPVVSPSATWLESREREMEKLSTYIKQQYKSIYHTKALPTVKHLLTEGSLSSNLAETVKKHPVCLVLMGGRSGSETEHFLFGSDAIHVAGESELPVCLIPQDAQLRMFRQVTFATNLLDQDIESLDYLVSLCKKIGSKLNIVHIREYGKALTSNAMVEQHIDKICSAGDALASYQEVYGKNVVSRLNSYCRDNDSDLLALSRVHHSALVKFFTSGTVDKLVISKATPLLIIPDLRTENQVASHDVLSNIVF